MNIVQQIYSILLKEFSDRNWWPVISNNPKLEICLGAILTQSTNWKNVEKAILKLNENNLIDSEKLKKIKVEELASLIISSGYYNQKAKKIKNFIEFLFKEFNGNLDYLFSLEIEELRSKLLRINGIGKETADSIILYAANKPIFVIDAYTKRIFTRLGYKEDDYDKLQKFFMYNIEKDSKVFNQYHALLVELGKRYCKKEPECSNCPLLNVCRTGKGLNSSVF